jgi:transcription initiation factor IIE alpha subunit
MGKIRYSAGKFFQISDELVNQYCPKLKKSSFAFLVVLLKLENKLGNPFYHSDEWMRREFGLSRSTCNRARKELESNRLIKYKARWQKETTKFKAMEYFIYPSKEIEELLNVISGLESKTTPKVEKNNHKQETEEIFQFWQEKIGKNYIFQFRPKTRNYIEERLKSFSLSKLKEAVENFSCESWWMEKHAKQGPAWFFESDERIERFLNLRPNNMPEDPSIKRLKEVFKKIDDKENEK